jgi:hypothetical protein
MGTAAQKVWERKKKDSETGFVPKKKQSKENQPENVGPVEMYFQGDR